MSAHTDWCARGHRCGLGQHRSEPVAARAFKTAGQVTGTRVQTARGLQFLELTISLRLPDDSEPVRADFAQQMMTALTTAISRTWYRRGANR